MGAVDRVVVEYVGVSVGWVQQQQKQLVAQQQPEQQKQLEQQQQQQRQERLLCWFRYALQRRFPVGQATATATTVEQARKRKRDRERRLEEAGSKATTERAILEAGSGGRRSTPFARAVTKRVFGAVLRSWEWRVACWRVEKRKKGPLSGV